MLDILTESNFVEQLGSGMTRILSAYDKDAFSFTSHFMTVRYYYPKGYTPQVTPQVESQDEIMKKIITFCQEPHSKKEIAQFCGLKDINHFTKKYLVPFLDSQRLVLTAPDKPNSSKQKYVAAVNDESSASYGKAGV